MIAISVHVGSPGAAQAVQLGAVEFLPKPVDFEKLREVLRRLLEHEQPTG